MNILEAIRSGKRFRKGSFGTWHECGNDIYEPKGRFSLDGFRSFWLEEDWEIEEEKKELSWDEITTVLAVGLARHNWEGDIAKLFEYIKKKLGFKE